MIASENPIFTETKVRPTNAQQKLDEIRFADWKRVPEKKIETEEEELEKLQDAVLMRGSGLFDLPSVFEKFRKKYKNTVTLAKLEIFIHQHAQEIEQAHKKGFLEDFTHGSAMFIGVDADAETVRFNYEVATYKVETFVRAGILKPEQARDILLFNDEVMNEFVKRGGYDPRSKFAHFIGAIRRLTSRVNKNKNSPRIEAKDTAEIKFAAAKTETVWKGQGSERQAVERVALDKIKNKINRQDRFSLEDDVAEFRKKYKDRKVLLAELTVFIYENKSKIIEMLKEAFVNKFSDVNSLFIGTEADLQKVTKEFEWYKERLDKYISVGLITSDEATEIIDFNNTVLDIFVEKGGKDPRKKERPVTK